MFRPWIGQEYAKTRLLILGESAFSWWEDDELRDPTLDHSKVSVESAIDSFPKCPRFFAVVSRALANEETPTRERLLSVWNRVAFTNYVSITVGEGARTRPSREMWQGAHEEFQTHLSQLKPRPCRLIVLGKGLWEEMPPTDLFVADDLQGYRIGDEMAMCFVLNHPAGGLSWRKLASVIYFTYERELRA
jgi:hypothetical protein